MLARRLPRLGSLHAMTRANALGDRSTGCPGNPIREHRRCADPNCEKLPEDFGHRPLQSVVHLLHARLRYPSDPARRKPSPSRRSPPSPAARPPGWAIQDQAYRRRTAVRKNIVFLIRSLKATAGLVKWHHQRSVGSAGACGTYRINISLDSIDPERYRAITRTGDILDALRGIDAARTVGFSGMKIKHGAPARCRPVRSEGNGKGFAGKKGWNCSESTIIPEFSPENQPPAL